MRVTLIYIISYNFLTRYSLLNSCSANDSRLSSQLSSNAVRIGSLLERAIRDGLANARYELMRDRECLKLSSCREYIHSSQPHLQNKMSLKYLLGGIQRSFKCQRYYISLFTFSKLFDLNTSQLRLANNSYGLKTPFLVQNE